MPEGTAALENTARARKAPEAGNQHVVFALNKITYYLSLLQISPSFAKTLFQCKILRVCWFFLSIFATFRSLHSMILFLFWAKRQSCSFCSLFSLFSFVLGLFFHLRW